MSLATSPVRPTGAAVERHRPSGTASPGSRAEPGTDRTVRARRLFGELASTSPGSREHRVLRDEIVELHLPLALYLARRYEGRGEPFDDIAQAGALGLVKAVDRFDPGRGVEFSTFAGQTILGEIRRHFRDRTWSVHVHRSLQERTGHVGRCIRDLTQELGRSPTVAEVSGWAGVSEEQVLEALECIRACRTASLESPARGTRTLGEVLGSDDTAFDRVDLHEALGMSLAQLPDRERRILQLRFFGDMTQAQIAARLGISQMHVSRLLSRTLGQLRQDLVGTG
ncbi:MAG TPA: SigB/SigF/SigG family RNA polymerase sigma factor [Mycobacteriales bacterium]